MMDKRYHTVRMDRAPQVGEIFSSSLLNPAPAPNKWWKVVQFPVAMVSGGFAVTLQECEPRAESHAPTREVSITDVRNFLNARPARWSVLDELLTEHAAIELAAKGPAGKHVHDLLRSKPPEPTLGMIYAELVGLCAEVCHLNTQLRQMTARMDAVSMKLETAP